MKKIITAALALPLLLAGANVQAQETGFDIAEGIAKLRETSDNLSRKKTEADNAVKRIKEGYEAQKAAAAKQTDEQKDLKRELKSIWKEKKARMKADFEAQKAANKAEHEAKAAKVKADLEAIKKTWQ